MRINNNFTRPVSTIICIANLIILAVTMIAINTNYDFALFLFNNLPLIPSSIITKFKLWQFVTYMFVPNPSSIIFSLINIFILTNFALTLEEILGSSKFLIYFLISGISSGICVFIISLITQTNYPLIGSEGVVISLIFAFAVFFSESTIYFNFFIPIKAKYFLVIYAVFFIVLEYFPTKNLALFGQFGSLLGASFFFRFLYDKEKARKSSRSRYAKKMEKIRESEGKSFIDKHHHHPEKNSDLKKQILLHLRSNSDINSLNDDEFQFVKYIDIIIERKHNEFTPVQNLESMSDEDFINEVRHLTGI